MSTLLIGTYTRGTRSEGIYQCRWDPVSGRFSALTLAAEADNPSFLILHDDSVFAVHETDDFQNSGAGAVARYRRDGQTLTLVATAGSGGAHPCHLAADGSRLAVANYSGATVGLFDIGGGGLETAAEPVRFAGRGPHPRQRAAHPHGVYFHGRELLVPDLGMDRVHRLDASTGAVRGAWAVPPGSGPRQLAMAPDGRAYLLNELANRIDVLNAGVIEQSVPTLPPDHAAGAQAIAGDVTPGNTGSTAGCIARSGDGSLVIASNRGVRNGAAHEHRRDSLACFPVDPATGRLGAPVFTACDPHPRHFLIVEGWVIVASRDAGTLTAFELWPGGSLGPAAASLSCPAPVCVLQVPDQGDDRRSA